MRELSVNKTEMVGGGQKNLNTANNSCSWKNFGKTAIGGAVAGATAGAAAGMAVHITANAKSLH